MIRFLDGPAQGAKLSLERAPRFLRVVIDQAGEIDALDQLDDKMRAGETGHVYELASQVQNVIACTRGNGCLFMAIADYRLYAQQPSQELLRDNQAWQEWAQGQANEST